MGTNTIQKGDPQKLPYLLKLLDDDSEVVRKAVSKELLAFGPELEDALLSLDVVPTEVEHHLINELIEISRRDLLFQQWKILPKIEDENQKLEQALASLASYLCGRTYPVELGLLLDQLAEEYRMSHSAYDARSLAKFLFEVKGLSGASENYYSPDHSNLIYVIEKKKGIPISLACIYILVGARLDLQIEGCNFPGHFLAKTFIGNEMVLVDCFNGGKFIHRKSFESTKNYKMVQGVIQSTTDVETIIIRVLNNLVRAFRNGDDEANTLLMEELLAWMTSEIGCD